MSIVPAKARCLPPICSRMSRSAVAGRQAPMLNEAMNRCCWPTRTSAPSLHAADLHVWAVPHDLTITRLQWLETHLSAEDRERMQQRRYGAARTAFLATRGALRCLLGQYLGLSPATIELCYGPSGKPQLAASHGSLHISVAHTSGLSLLAFGPTVVGVDLERSRALPALERLLLRWFSTTEQAMIAELPPTQRHVAFYSGWTRKEAYAKAEGRGLRLPLRNVEPAGNVPDRAGWHTLRTPASQGWLWQARHLQPASGYIGAVVCAQAAVRLQCWAWDPDGSD